MFSFPIGWRPAAVGLLALVLVTTVLSIAGCSSSKNRVGGVLDLDTDLKLTVVADADTNPDHAMKSSPVVIRFYELNSPLAFEKADFVDIYERDEKLLGKDMVGKQVLRPVLPGEQREEVLVLNKGTTHVALYAEFAQYQGSTFKVVFPVTQNNVFRNSVAVRLSGNRLSLTP